MLAVSAYLFLVSLALVSIATPLAIHLGRRWNVVDRPGPRKIHSENIPLSGGWAIFATFLFVVWAHVLGAMILRDGTFVSSLPAGVTQVLDSAHWIVIKAVWLTLGAAVVFVLGLIDDTIGMSVRSRLLVQFILAGALVYFGVRPSPGLLPEWAACLIGVVWLVAIMNSFNFLDGLDGLSAGVALIATSALLVIMATGNQYALTPMLAMLTGILLGFLRFNFQPARVFLGSSGSLLLGYFLATSTLLVTYVRPAESTWLLPVLAPIFILSVPIYDTVSVVLIRLVQKRSVSVGDQSHFHHRLMRLGFSHRHTVIFIYLISIGVSLSAVLLISASLTQGVLILAQILAILSLIIITERVAAVSRRQLIRKHLKTRTSDTPDEKTSLITNDSHQQ